MGHDGLTHTQAFRHFDPFLGGLPCRDIHTLETATGQINENKLLIVMLNYGFRFDRKSLTRGADRNGDSHKHTRT